MIGSLVRQAREKRAIWTAGGHPRDPVLVKILGVANRSLSGVSVTRESILRCPAFWRGVGLISDYVAKLPLRVYRWLDEDHNQGSEPARDHPAYRLLRHRPCEADWVTPFIFKQTLQADAIADGNGYAFIERGKSAEPKSLIHLNSQRTYPVRMNGVLWYVTRVRGPEGQPGELRKLLSEDVLHIKGLGPDCMQGYETADVGRDVLGRALATQDFGCKFYANGMNASGILMVPVGVDEEELSNLRESWDKLHTGIDNACKIMLLEEGYKYERTTINPQEAQSVETEEMMLTHVSNLLRIPAHKLGSKTRNGYNSLEQEDKAFLNECLDPWLVNWEQECKQKLLTTEEIDNDTHYVAFDRSRIVQADSKTMYEGFNLALQGGWMCRDEVRAALNMNPLPDGQGKVFLQALNMGNAGGNPNAAKPGETKPAEPAPGQTPPNQNAAGNDGGEAGERSKQIAEACRVMLAETITRAVRRIGEHARRVAKRPHEFGAWLNGIDNEHRAIIEDMLSGPVSVLEAASPNGGAEKRTAELGGEICRRMHDELLEASECQPGELPDSVERRIGRLEQRMGLELTGR